RRLSRPLRLPLHHGGARREPRRHPRRLRAAAAEQPRRRACHHARGGEEDRPPPPAGPAAMTAVPDFVTRYVNLADAQLGAHAVLATDEFFGAKARLLKSEPPVFEPGRYDAHGKWMDGWETRRRRTPGYDYCVVRLAA